MRKRSLLVIPVIALLLATSACGSGTPEPTAAPKPTDIPQPTDTPPPTNTPVPTDTPIPTSTPTPKPTNTPRPTDTPEPSLEVQAGRDYLSSDYLHIVGQVVNPTTKWLEYVKVVATLYDEDGAMLGTDFTYTELDKVPPNDVGVFNLASDVGGQAANVASYDLAVQARETNPPYTALTASVSRDYAEYGYHHLVGVAENTRDENCEYVKIVAGFYDAEDNVVGVDFTYTELDTVPAGGKSPFDLSASDAGEFDHYRIWVSGRPVD
jgi:hypothetical protein